MPFDERVVHPRLGKLVFKNLKDTRDLSLSGGLVTCPSGLKGVVTNLAIYWYKRFWKLCISKSYILKTNVFSLEWVVRRVVRARNVGFKNATFQKNGLEPGP